MKLTDTRIIVSGSTLETYVYIDGNISYGFTIPNKYRKTRSRIIVVDEESKLRKLESRQKGMRRANSTLRRLINANAYKWKRSNKTLYTPKFVTLTFKENIKDIKTANPIFSKFIKRLSYKENKNLKYVVVTEFQDKYKRGAIHYHTIFFNLEYIWGDDLAKIWKEGFVNIKNINGVSNIGAYVCKYMSKEFEDERLDGKKRYFASRGLKKPIEIKEQSLAHCILSKVPKELLRFQKEFDGHQEDVKVKYSQYQIDREKSFGDVIPELKHFL